MVTLEEGEILHSIKTVRALVPIAHLCLVFFTPYISNLSHINFRVLIRLTKCQKERILPIRECIFNVCFFDTLKDDSRAILLSYFA